MPITRSTWNDDDGSGTSGTILNNAELQKIYDNVETFRGAAAVVDANVLVSTVHNWFPIGFGKVDAVINVNPAADLLITGLIAGVIGQRVLLRNLSPSPSTVVSIGHAHAGSAAANQIACFATSAPYPMGNRGSVELVYSGTNWLMVNQTPGAWIAPPFVASDYFVNIGTGTWPVAAADVAHCAYVVQGRMLHFNIGTNNTVLTGAPVGLSRKMFGGFQAARVLGGVFIHSATAAGYFQMATGAGTQINFFRDINGTAWLAGAAVLRAFGSVEIT